jgi:hypothetical protein
LSKFRSSYHLSILFLWLVVISIVALIYLPELIRYLSAIFQFPYDWDPFEGYTVWAARLIREGQSPYTNPLEYPFVSFSYTPLYPLIVAVTGGGGALDLSIARGISVVSLLGILSLSFLLARNLGLARGLAAIPAVIIISNYDTAVWMPFARVDMLCVALTIAGILCLAKAEESHDTKQSFWAVGLALLFFALMTKHVVAPLFMALAIYGVVKKSLRKTSIVTLGLLLAYFALLLFVFGMNMGSSLMASRYQDMELNRMASFLIGSFRQYPVLYIGFLGIGIVLGRERILSPVGFFMIYCLFFFILAGHTGSAVNYMIFPVIALGIGFAFLVRINENIKWIGHVVLALLIVHLLVAQGSFLIKKPSGAYAKNNEEIVDLLKLSQKTPLVDELPMLSIKAGFRPAIDTESTRALIWKKYGKVGWEKRLFDMIKSGPDSEIILSGAKLGSLYPELMKGYRLAGEISYETWIDTQRMVAFTRPELQSRLKCACDEKGGTPFYCKTRQKN